MHKAFERSKDTQGESGLDRRTFLKTAAASAALGAPAAAVAPSAEAAARRPSESGHTGRREHMRNTGGLSRARLGRMHDVMAGYVERGEVPGIVTLVSRRGEVHVDAIGKQSFGVTRCGATRSSASPR